MITALIMLAAVLLDWLVGEPKRFHPLVGFGRLVRAIESRLYGVTPMTPRKQKIRGIFDVVLLVAPLVVATTALSALPVVGNLISAIILYAALGHRSLHDHARPVADLLRRNEEARARYHASLMVSRDSAALAIAPAATESVLENGNDGVFGALFWFAVLGAPGAILYRLANTLDAMWGYRNERYLHFGWAAARFDDVLNYVPARLTAFTYALLGNTRSALTCWRRQAPTWDSPNAGPVMAAGAGALNVTIGGPARYEGEWHARPVLGAGRAPDIDDIERALKLVREGVCLWLLVALLAGLAHA